MEDTNLEGANLEITNLTNAKLSYAIVDKEWFEKLDNWRTLGKEEIKEMKNLLLSLK